MSQKADGDATSGPAEGTSDNFVSDAADFNAAVMEQHNQLRKEEAEKHPYVADKETLDTLKKEYQGGSEVFKLKIDRLEQTYSHIRRTRGDGNCFFRAFIFSYLEHLLVTGDKQECSRLTACLQAWQPKLIESGYQEMVFEEALGLLLQHVEGINEGLLGLEALEGAYRDDISNYIIMLLRFITSAEIKQREDFFLPFILGMYDDPPASVEAFCQRYVEPMAEESDNIHIVALTDALQVPVRVVHLDRSGAAPGHNQDDLDVNTHDFVPEACQAQGAAPLVHVLYRPGHYDMLYPRLNS